MTPTHITAPNDLAHSLLHCTTRSEQALLTELQLAGESNPDEVIQKAFKAGQLCIASICSCTGYRQFQPGPLQRQTPSELLPPAYLRHTGSLALESAVLAGLRTKRFLCSVAGDDGCFDDEGWLTLYQLWYQLRKAPAHIRAFVRAMRKAPAHYQEHYQRCLDHVRFSEVLEITECTSMIEAGMGVLTFTYDRFTAAATVRETLQRDPYLADHLVMLYHNAVGRELTAVVLFYAPLAQHERLLAGVAAYCQQYHQQRGFVCTAEIRYTNSPLGEDPDAYLHQSLR